MYTRKQYLDKECTHSEYYGQFVTTGHLQEVKAYIGLDRLINSTNEHLNDIPLQEWDNIQPPLGTGEEMKKRGDYLTQAGIVCIAKAAAKQIISNHQN